MMKLYDISMEISPEMTVYRNEDRRRPALEVVRDYSTGSVYETVIRLEMHTGTHMDAPLHMLEGGGTIDHARLEQVVTWCKVLDLTGAANGKDKGGSGGIRREDLEGRGIGKGDFVLFKTRNSFREDFDSEFVFLEKSGAEYLQSLGVIGVGTDALGIERSQPKHETHKALLGNGIVILEGLRLRDVPEGRYFLFAAPLKIRGAEAAPVRAVLVEGP